MKRKDANVPGWLKQAENAEQLELRLSPLDDFAPLPATHVPNEFVSIEGRKHGRFRWYEADTIR